MLQIVPDDPQDRLSSYSLEACRLLLRRSLYRLQQVEDSIQCEIDSGSFTAKERISLFSSYFELMHRQLQIVNYFRELEPLLKAAAQADGNQDERVMLLLGQMVAMGFNKTVEYGLPLGPTMRPTLLKLQEHIAQILAADGSIDKRKESKETNIDGDA